MQLQNISPTKLESIDDDARDVLHQTLSMAYYNLAVEYEYCKDNDAATETFLKAQYFTRLSKNPNKL